MLFAQHAGHESPVETPMKNLILRLSACGFLIAPPAVAAEMPIKAAPSSAPAQYNWTGFYAGLAGGLAWGHSQFIDADPTNLNGLLGSPLTKQFDVSGGVVGGTVGHNWQFNNWVTGLEGDFSWVNKQGISNSIPPFNTVGSNATREHWLGTGRVRLGVMPVDRRLFYITGGFAVAGVEAIFNGNIARDGSLAATQTRWGWTAGGGFEAAVVQNWSLKLEYLYVGLEDKSYFPPVPVLPDFQLVRRKVTLDDNIVRVGLNYRFQ
jgi:outer membrane immunogenic protein